MISIGKIALAVPNIELACEQLAEQGVTVSAPDQFRDVGYLTKFTDPEGFTIELIEHWFKGNRQEESIDTKRLGGGAHLNLITLRASDIEPVERACAEWGMTPLSIQHVDSLGFTLYFYASTSERPPSADLTAVENREWTYQRKYSVLEVQHLHGVDTIRAPQKGRSGYAGITLSGATSASTDGGMLLFS